MPDVITFAKGLGNGLAIGGIAGRAEVIDSLQANSMSTFGGNPLATAGAKATIDYVLAHDLQGNALKMGGRLMAGLQGVAERTPAIGEVRGRGLMIGVELVAAPTNEPSPKAALLVQEAAKARGLLVGKGGLYGNVLRIAPPLTLTEAEAEEGLARLEDAITEATEAPA